MALGKQLPIRLDAVTEARLQKASELIGTTKSGLLRFLADTFTAQLVTSDGAVSMPPNWRELLPERDGRIKIDMLNEPKAIDPEPLPQQPVNYKDKAKKDTKNTKARSKRKA